jgi:hypothetical protein
LTAPWAGGVTDGVGIGFGAVRDVAGELVGEDGAEVTERDDLSDDEGLGD